MKKNISFVMTIFAVTMAFCFTSYAGQWIQGERHETPNGYRDDWTYNDDNGNKVTDTWIQDQTGKYWYYVGSDGIMLYDESSIIDDKEYFFSGDGIAHYDSVALSDVPEGTQNVIRTDQITQTEPEQTALRKSPIEIMDLGCNVNSVGGASIYMYWRNGSGKDIKYIYFDFVPYNGVGDRQSCEIRGYSNFTGYVTGPIKSEDEVGDYYNEFHGAYSHVWKDEHGRPYKYDKNLNKVYYSQDEICRTFSQDEYWDCAWYNYSIKKVSIVGISIEYMDGTTQTVNPADVLSLTTKGILKE